MEASLKELLRLRAPYRVYSVHFSVDFSLDFGIDFGIDFSIDISRLDTLDSRSASAY